MMEKKKKKKEEKLGRGNATRIFDLDLFLTRDLAGQTLHKSLQMRLDVSIRSNVTYTLIYPCASLM